MAEAAKRKAEHTRPPIGWSAAAVVLLISGEHFSALKIAQRFNAGLDHRESEQVPNGTEGASHSVNGSFVRRLPDLMVATRLSQR